MAKAKRDRGRPARTGSPSTALLKARVSPEEKQRVAEHCAQEGTTESELIRGRLADVLGPTSP